MSIRITVSNVFAACGAEDKRVPRQISMQEALQHVGERLFHYKAPIVVAEPCLADGGASLAAQWLSVCDALPE